MTTKSFGTGNPDQSEPADTRQSLEAQLRAINAHDATAFASFYAEDAVVVDPQYPEPLRGRAAIEQDAEVFLRALPDIEFSYTNTLVDDRLVAGEGTIVGTNTGPLQLPTGEEIPATGRRLEFPMAFFSRFDESGKIVEERRTGLNPIFQGGADFDLELIESRTLDGHTQELIYRPTLHV